MRLAAPVLAEHHAGRAAEAGQRQQQPGVLLAGAGARQADDVGRRGPQQPAHARAGRSRREAVTTSQALRPSSGSSASVPSSAVGRSAPRTSTCQVCRAASTRSARSATSAISACGDHGVDQAVLGQVLGGLHALGERLAVERLVDARPEEADRGAGLGDGHVPERSPRGEHAAEGGVAQVDQVRQPGLLVPGDRPR